MTDHTTIKYQAITIIILFGVIGFLGSSLAISRTVQRGCYITDTVGKNHQCNLNNLDVKCLSIFLYKLSN